MRLPSAFEKAEFTYFLIAIASIFALLSVAAHALTETKPDVYSAWLDYPGTVYEGGAVNFKLFVKNEGARNSDYVVEVFADGVKQKRDLIQSAANSTVSRAYSLANGFRRGEKHEIRVSMFLRDEPYDRPGSSKSPYELFFTVSIK